MLESSQERHTKAQEALQIIERAGHELMHQTMHSVVVYLKKVAKQMGVLLELRKLVRQLGTPSTTASLTTYPVIAHNQLINEIDAYKRAFEGLKAFAGPVRFPCFPVPCMPYELTEKHVGEKNRPGGSARACHLVRFHLESHSDVAQGGIRERALISGLVIGTCCTVSLYNVAVGSSKHRRHEVCFLPYYAADPNLPRQAAAKGYDCFALSVCCSRRISSRLIALPR